MKTNTIETQSNEQTPLVVPEKAAPAKKAASSGKKAGKANKPKKVAKPAPKAKGKPTGAREGSKTAKVMDLLKRPGGATLKEIMKATNWQAHSVRGFISGALGKKLGLTVISEKAENGERTYRLGR